jgi:AcrR family transcriptional regulator
MLTKAKKKTGRGRPTRNSRSGQDIAAAAAADSRANILLVATQEFAEKGLSGARVDDIGERTNTSKRMLYYWFKSKVGLYRAVLESCYANIRQIDTSLDLDSLPPTEALRELVRVTFDYHNAHPDFVRLVMNENIHHGVHIAHIANIKTRSRIIIAMLQKLINRGVDAGAMRPGIDPVELHMSISALCFFNVSNRYTFARIFQRDFDSAAAIKARREVVVDTIERWCKADSK